MCKFFAHCFFIMSAKKLACKGFRAIHYNKNGDLTKAKPGNDSCRQNPFCRIFSYYTFHKYKNRFVNHVFVFRCGCVVKRSRRQGRKISLKIRSRLLLKQYFSLFPLTASSFYDGFRGDERQKLLYNRFFD